MKLGTLWYLLFFLSLLLVALGGGLQRNLASLQLLDGEMADPPYTCLLASSFCVGQSGEKVPQTEGVADPTVVHIVDNGRDYAILLEGALLLQANRRQEALALWREDIRVARYLFNLAQLVSDPEEAIELYRLSTAVSPTFKANHKLGVLLQQRAENEEALQALWAAEALIDDAGSNVERANFYLALGNTLLSSENAVEAERYLQAAVDLRPDSVSAQIGLARARLAQADPKRAAALLEQVAVAQPERADAHYWLGQAYWALNRPIDAIAQFEAVVSLRADFVGAWKALGDLYLKQGNQAQAVTAYRRYLALEPEDADTLARVDELEKLLDTNR